MQHIVLVGIGALGSIARYIVSGFAQDASGSIGFPFGRFTVNVVGCLTIGILTQLAESRGILSPEARALLVIGVLGGFTTFSTFGNEIVALPRDEENLIALTNIGASILLGLGAVYGGRAWVSAIWR